MSKKVIVHWGVLFLHLPKFKRNRVETRSRNLISIVSLPNSIKTLSEVKESSKWAVTHHCAFWITVQLLRQTSNDTDCRATRNPNPLGESVRSVRLFQPTLNFPGRFARESRVSSNESSRRTGSKRTSLTRTEAL